MEFNEPIRGWKEYFDHGESYLQTAINGRQNQKKFNPIMIHNLTTMAIEKFFMAFFLYNRKVPKNHTMQDLAESATELIALDVSLHNDLVVLDKYLNLCSLDAFQAKELTISELEFGLDVAARTKAFFALQLPIAD